MNLKVVGTALARCRNQFRRDALAVLLDSICNCKQCF